MSSIDDREQLVRIDASLADIALKQEQLRQLKTYEGWKLAFQGMTAEASLMAAGVALGALLTHIIR